VTESAARQGIDAEIIAVDDGSQDKSLAILRQQSGVHVISLSTNRGKGAAVKAGFSVASKDIVIIQDADLEYSPDDYTNVIGPILHDEADAVMGSRFLTRRLVFFGEHKSPYLTHFIGNKVIIWLTNLLYGNSATDYEGCYKAFSRKTVQDITVNADGFEYDNELICKLLKRGYRIAEVPIGYEPRSYESGKKITWKHGLRMVWSILKYRFVD
jgi:glycosyltransferase involved in cell wall biosynthesis